MALTGRTRLGRLLIVDGRSEMQDRHSGAEKNSDTGRDPKQSGNLHLPIL